MPLAELTEFLQTNQVRCDIIEHATAFTAQGIAALTHIPGNQFAKTVIVKLDGAMAMAVAPASFHVDLELLKRAAGASSAVLASETEFRGRFPHCETGAMPPFGNLYGMPVYADERLAGVHDIVFNAGTHRELMRLAWADFERLVQPRMARFSVMGAGAHAA